MIKIATGALEQSGRNVRMNLNGGAKQKSTACLVGAKTGVILSAKCWLHLQLSDA